MALKEKKEQNGIRRLTTVVNIPELNKMTKVPDTTLRSRFDRGEFGEAAILTKTGDKLIDLSKADLINDKAFK